VGFGAGVRRLDPAARRALALIERDDLHARFL